ncbi:hypothetical protein KY285_036029 [Solanum tuberosum]|nr:hypothetical protein KY285_036029 [Solanum tuberosum]
MLGAMLVEKYVDLKTIYTPTDIREDMLSIHALDASIRGWEYCRPILVVDGTHLKSTYEGTMLIASTLDPGGTRINNTPAYHYRWCKEVYGGVPVDFEINRKTPTLDDFVMPNMRESQLVALETGQTYVSSLVKVDYENICVTPLEVAEAGKTKFNQFGDIEGENTHISSVQHVRTKIPGKYAQSPYTKLSESGGTSVNTVKYYLWRHPFINYKGFDMYSEVILHFKKWVDRKLSKKRGKKTSFFTASSNPIDLKGKTDLK